MSDISDALTNKEFAKLRKRIYRIYAQANEDISSTVREYWNNLKKRDEAMREQVNLGKMTKDEYKMWRITQEARGKHFVQMQTQVAKRMTEANKTAVKYMNASAVNVYEDTFGSDAFMLEQLTGTNAFAGISFTMMNESAVRNLVINNPETMPYYDENYPKAKGVLTNKDIKWGQKIITNAAMQGIVQGKGVLEIANEIQSRIVTMSRTSAIRAARTSLGSAQNAGHQAAYSTANAQGVTGKKTWMAYHDRRVRDSHAHLDGVQIGVNDVFPNGLRFPKDPKGEPGEVYNCRCRIVYAPDVVADQFKTKNTVESYYKWKKERLGLATAKSQKNNSNIPIDVLNNSPKYHPLGQNGNMYNLEEQIYSYVNLDEAPGIFVNRSDMLYYNAQRVNPIEGYSDFTIHTEGNKFKIDYNAITGEGVLLDAKEFAQLIRDSKSYQGGNVRLLACSSGAEIDGEEPLAQTLARELGVKVLAPTETLTVDSNGDTFISDNDRLSLDWGKADKKDKHKYIQTGEWKEFEP